MFLGSKVRPVRSDDNLPPSVSRLSRQCGILNILQPYRPPLSITGIVLLYFSCLTSKTFRRKGLPPSSGSKIWWVSSEQELFASYSLRAQRTLGTEDGSYIFLQNLWELLFSYGHHILEENILQNNVPSAKRYCYLLRILEHKTLYARNIRKFLFLSWRGMRLLTSAERGSAIPHGLRHQEA
jgi:hypothetical protein